MTSTIDPDHTLVYLLTLETNTTGSVQRYRYTDHDRDLTYAANAYTSTRLAVVMERQTALMEDAPIEITVGLIQPLVDYVNATAHAPITVTLEMIDPNNLASEAERIWYGRIKELRLNPDGIANTISFTVASPKFLVEKRPLGMVCGSTCIWRFGDKNCKFNTAPLEQTLTVIGINGLIIETSAYNQNQFFQRGYMQRGDLKILITEHISDTQRRLAKPPPLSWLGQSVTMAPGCDKTLQTCRTIWNNESNFGGFGYGIPNEDPTLPDAL